MAELTLAEAELARDNLALRDELNRKMLQIESQTIAWMAEATTLYGDVVAEDRPSVLAMRDELIAKLTVATTI